MPATENSPSDPYIYVFISGEALQGAQASGQYRPPSLDLEGFVHASPRDQLHRVANKFYAAIDDVRLLHIDPALVTAEVRWEPAAGALYPHIYGPLNLTAVVRMTVVARASDGALLPDSAA